MAPISVDRMLALIRVPGGGAGAVFSSFTTLEEEWSAMEALPSR